MAQDIISKGFQHSVCWISQWKSYKRFISAQRSFSIQHSKLTQVSRLQCLPALWSSVKPWSVQERTIAKQFQRKFQFCFDSNHNIRKIYRKVLFQCGLHLSSRCNKFQWSSCFGSSCCRSTCICRWWNVRSRKLRSDTYWNTLDLEFYNIFFSERLKHVFLAFFSEHKTLTRKKVTDIPI